MRPAAAIVKKSRSFHSQVCLRVGRKFADAGNILTILMLAASFGTVLEIEANGPDELEAVSAVASIFEDFEVGQQDVGDEYFQKTD